ncbi:hypothetical protein PV10_06240 [Exophiala mesophila]|uniref:Ribosomal protein bL31m N-terminal domain-containing protein n=1 Tax=Exophiala mesophila TaxID=212818 RepID=A0A0D1XU59_EXOME|nr:uncharacterized protein PV10_06240 [Exophiala mesophila]KIV91731.1 hypothetical protein PV10_06240 [Exophiala mesophila]
MSSSTALRPILRPHSLPSLPSSSTAKTTFICQSCRHARLLRRPKRIYTFTQLVTLSDGSAFTMRTTSPVPVYRSTRDTRNAPLWNPTSKDVMNVEEDDSGRLAGFRARFGTSFDALTPESSSSKKAKGDSTLDVQEEGSKGANRPKKPVETQNVMAEGQFLDKNEFAEDDMNLLDLITSFGQGSNQQSSMKSGPEAPKKKGGKK